MKKWTRTYLVSTAPTLTRMPHGVPLYESGLSCWPVAILFNHSRESAGLWSLWTVSEGNYYMCFKRNTKLPLLQCRTMCLACVHQVTQNLSLLYYFVCIRFSISPPAALVLLNKYPALIFPVCREDRQRRESRFFLSVYPAWFRSCLSSFLVLWIKLGRKHIGERRRRL